MENLTSEQIEEFHEAFALFDKDGSGSISKEELKTVMQNLNIDVTEEQISSIMIDHDTDESGQIEFDEFCEFMAKSLHCPQTEEEKAECMEATFKKFDSDGSGMISKDELKTVMHQLGETLTDDEIDSMIREADTNGDGQIDYHEFVSMFHSKS